METLAEKLIRKHREQGATPSPMPTSPDKNVCRRILIRVAESHIGLYSGKIVGEYLEKLVDLNHPTERAQKLIAYILGAFDRVQIHR